MRCSPAMRGLAGGMAGGVAAVIAAFAFAIPAIAPAAQPSSASQVAQDSQTDRPALKIRVRGGEGAFSGARVRYRFIVSNAGTAAADDVKVHVRLPRLLRHLRGGRRLGPHAVVLNLGRIAPSGARSQALSARVGPDAAGRKIIVRARTTFRGPLPPP